MSIVVLGAVFVDIKGYPSTAYIPAGRNAGRVRYVHGGVSRNIAEDIGNMELRPIFISLVDETGVGDDVLRKLNRHKVNTDYVRRVENGMGTWLAVFDNNNDVVASISSRPDLSPILRTLAEHGDEIFSQADSILLELDMDQEIVKEVFRLGEKYHRPVYAAGSNMSIAMDRRDFFKRVDCFVCNRGEAEILFSTAFEGDDPAYVAQQLAANVRAAQIPSMVVTMGDAGAVWATRQDGYGVCPASQVPVADTTGAGDAFFAGVAAGLTYGKSLSEACDIGARLAASVICTLDNTCPRFLPGEFGLEAPQEP